MYSELPSRSPFLDYDTKQPLDLHDKIIEEFSGGTLHDITYMSLPWRHISSSLEALWRRLIDAADGLMLLPSQNRH